MSRALILIGHGSHLNADSSAPVYAHAAAIRASGAFDEVHEAFWKEEPPLTSVLHLSGADEVLIVPLFLSEGYFTREVLPREIGLTGPVMRDGKRTFRYLPPVGTHPAMTSMILRRAGRALGTDPVRRGGASLIVVGHGTERNSTSANTVYALVERLRERGDFGSVTCGFLDEAPYISDVVSGSTYAEVVFVPFFVAEGWHTRETIPAELGLTGDVTSKDGRTLWYTPPVGTLPEMAEVILAMTRDAVVETSGAAAFVGSDECGVANGTVRRLYREHASAREAFLSRVDGSLGPVGFMDVAIERVRDGQYRVRHVDDVAAEVGRLASHTDPDDARDIARFRADGSYRPLRSTADLRSGWVFSLVDADGLWRVLSGLYPVAIDDWYRGRHLPRPAIDFSAWSARQTAMYADVRKLEPEGVREVTATLCATCHRSRLWEDDRTRADTEPFLGSADTQASSRTLGASPTGDGGKAGDRDPEEFASRTGHRDASGGLPILRVDRTRTSEPSARTTLVVPCVEPCTLFATHARERVTSKSAFPRSTANPA